MGKSNSQTKDPEIIMEYDFNDDDKKVEIPEVKVEKSEKPKKERVKEKKGWSREKKERLRGEIEAPIDSVIQRLLDSEKTFVENITRNAKRSPLSSFYPFPKNITTLSVGKNEAVVLIVRCHWISLVPRGLLAMFTLLLPFLMSFSLSAWFGTVGSAFFTIGLFLFFMMLAGSVLLDGFLKWFFQMNLITTKRIVDVDFVSITSHRVSETTFDQVQDVSHCPAGPLASFFDYGHLSIQTAAAKNEFEFHNIPRPRDVQDTILDLRELRRQEIAREK